MSGGLGGVFRGRGPVQPPPPSPAVLNLSVFGVSSLTPIAVLLTPDSFPPIAGIPDLTLLGRFAIPIPPTYTGGASLHVEATGYVPYDARLKNAQGVDMPLPRTGSIEIFGPTLVPVSQRPPAVRQPPLPPFDHDDSGGKVHTTPPPELVIPTGADPLFMRADFNGVTLNRDRWGGDPPFLKGANSTPLSMLMSPMVLVYPRKWQDAHLTESAERGYTHYVIAGDGWNLAENGFDGQPSTVVTWAQYVHSWGFYVVYWRGTPLLNDPILQALVDAHALDWSIPGEEVDGKLTAQQYAAILGNTLAITGGGIPIGAHLTMNFPEGFPRDTFFDGRSMPGFADYNGKVHLCWQANQDESAGAQGARLYYARQRVNLGLVGGDGRAAPDSRVYAYETMATAQLYGKCDEAYGNLRSLELLYTTRLDPRIRPMSGYGNGGRLPDGWAL